MIKVNDVNLSVKIDDWVRFMLNGHLVIGVVEYVRKSGYERDTYAYTNIGSVAVSSILEVRSIELPLPAIGPPEQP